MMFENRIRGTRLSKSVSYLYIVMAVLSIVLVMILNTPATVISTAFYIIMFIVVYLISTKFENNKNTWIYLLICGIITLIFSLSILGLCIAVLLAVAANDIRKELE